MVIIGELAKDISAYLLIENKLHTHRLIEYSANLTGQLDLIIK